MDIGMLKTLSDFTLYEVFFETGTQLGGSLVALERKARENHDEEAAQKWSDEQDQMIQDRSATSSKDRDKQIRLIERWVSRRDELERLING